MFGEEVLSWMLAVIMQTIVFLYDFSSPGSVGGFQQILKRCVTSYDLCPQKRSDSGLDSVGSVVLNGQVLACQACCRPVRGLQVASRHCGLCPLGLFPET